MPRLIERGVVFVSCKGKGGYEIIIKWRRASCRSFSPVMNGSKVMKCFAKSQRRKGEMEEAKAPVFDNCIY